MIKNLLDLLQSVRSLICLEDCFGRSRTALYSQCLTGCNKDLGYLQSRPVQKVLLLRLLQDVSSVTGQLPLLYRVQRRPDVNWLNSLGTGAQSNVYQVTPLAPNTEATQAVRIPVFAKNRWGSEEGQELLKVSELLQTITLFDVKFPQAIRREIVSHWQLRHANVLPLIGIYYETEESAPWMLVPLMKYGSADVYLEEFPGVAQFVSVVRIFHPLVFLYRGRGIDYGVEIFDAAYGLAYLHSQRPPVIHGDIHVVST